MKALLCAISLLVVGCELPPEEPEKPLDLPSFSALGQPGTAVHLSDFRNQVVLVDFWATWCVPCRELSPVVETLYRKFGKKGLAVISVSTGESQEVVKAFLKQNPKSAPVYLDVDGKFGRAAGATALPTCIVFGKEGEVAGRWSGASTQYGEALDSAITALLVGGRLSSTSPGSN